MIQELLTAGPVFWITVLVLVLLIAGSISNQLAKRKLQRDLQAFVDRDAAKHQAV